MKYCMKHFNEIYIVPFVNVSVLIKFSLETGVFLSQLSKNLHRAICRGCVSESPRRGDSNAHPRHVILCRNIDKYHFLSC